MANNIKSTIFIIIFTYFITLNSNAQNSQYSNFLSGISQEQPAFTLQQLSDTVNRSLPVMVDKETRMDSTQVKGKQFIYNHTMVNYTAAKIDINDFSDSIKENIEGTACALPQMQLFLNANITVIFAYYDKNHKFLTKAVVDPAKCN